VVFFCYDNFRKVFTTKMRGLRRVIIHTARNKYRHLLKEKREKERGVHFMKRKGKRMLAILLSMVLLLSGGTSVPLLAASGAGNTEAGTVLDVETIAAQGMEAIRAAAAPTAGEGKFLAAIAAPVSGSIAISTAAELNAIRNNLSGKYHLANDIDLSGWGEWTPIGDSFPTAFSGVFDGQGYIIRNLTSSGADQTYPQYSGLFGLVTNATIKNVGLEGASISNDVQTGVSYAGGIVAYVHSYSGATVISNCYITGGSVTASFQQNADSGAAYVGGIAGRVDTGAGSATISNCYNAGTVVSVSAAYVPCAGGIVGLLGGDTGTHYTISNCYNSGSVATTAVTGDLVSSAGGIAGSIGNVTVSGCYNTGNISSASSRFSYAGGIIATRSILPLDGGVDSYAISNCHNTGAVTANSTSYEAVAGGIVGSYSNNLGLSVDHSTHNHNTNSAVRQCYNTGHISAVASEPKAGGIIGELSGYDTTVSACYNAGDISAANDSSSVINQVVSLARA
jgi:hypothetical protein